MTSPGSRSGPCTLTISPPLSSTSTALSVQLRPCSGILGPFFARLRRGESKLAAPTPLYEIGSMLTVLNERGYGHRPEQPRYLVSYLLPCRPLPCACGGTVKPVGPLDQHFVRHPTRWTGILRTKANLARHFPCLAPRPRKGPK